MDTLQAVVLALLAGGGGSVLVIFGKGIRNFLTGRAAEDRARIQALVRERDEADAYRRTIAEHASELRGVLFEKGFGDLVPDWPKNPTTPTTRRSRRS